MDPQTLGRRLRRLRELHGLEQQEVAKKVGLSQPQLSRLERGAIDQPSVFYIEPLAAFYGVTIPALLGREHIAAGALDDARQRAIARALENVAEILQQLKTAEVDGDDGPAAADMAERDPSDLNGDDSANYIYTASVSRATQ